MLLMIYHYMLKATIFKSKQDLVGTVKGYLPFIGYVTILISEMYILNMVC